MNHEDETISVGVIESARCLIADDLDVDTATTLIALISEDPVDWDEAMSVWGRYRTPAVCEFTSSLPFKSTNRAEIIQAVKSSDAWVVIDFVNKRICTGGEIMAVGRDAVFAMVIDESGKQQCPLSIHLPPWWELNESASPEAVNEARVSPMNRPYVDRNVLYGDAFLRAVAAKVLEVVGSESWRANEASDNERARSFTVAIHRDWLMTPREDLGGRIPRELLHGAMDWSDKVTDGQRLRFSDGGPMIAAPNDWPGFDTAPMGSQEMYLYFDFCREVIGAAWHWCESEEAKAARQDSELALNELIQFLGQVKDQWLGSPFEGGSPPSFIIDCDRRRVPRGAGVAIEGIDAVQVEEHIPDCDCPICMMMAEGMFGVSFCGMDGHHLELDEEFAFSTMETLEEWEAEQRDYAEYNAKMERDVAEQVALGEAEDVFASAWSGIRDDDSESGKSPFAGKLGGNLKMAFMVAEIVSELESCSESRDEVKSLNESFANYRRSDDDDRPRFASELKANLQSLAERYPQLVSKSADLQSRIDDAERASAISGSDDSPW